MVMMAVSVLLSTTNFSTWRGDSSGDTSYKVGDNSLTNSNMYIYIQLVSCIIHCEVY